MKDRIKCVFYIDKKRKGQSVRKFQKGKRDFFKNFTILSSVLFFCVLHSAIWIPKLQYQSEKSRLSEDIVYSNFFRRQPVYNTIYPFPCQLFLSLFLNFFYFFSLRFFTLLLLLPFSLYTAFSLRTSTLA